MRATSHLPAAHAPAPLACAQLVPVLKGLGARHAKYGVEAAHYPVVGSAFLKTLSVGLGDAYTEEVAAAYTAMWTVVADTMQAGAAEAAAVPKPKPISDRLRARQKKVLARRRKKQMRRPAGPPGAGPPARAQVLGGADKMLAKAQKERKAIAW